MKILSQTLKRFRPTMGKSFREPQLSSWTRIKDFILTLGAASGVLAAALWIGGRFYAYGYFERMNIPLYFLSFSIGEYAETYVISLITNLIIYIHTHSWSILIVVIVLLVAILVVWIVRKRYTKLKIREVIEKIDDLNQKFLVVYFCVLFLASLVAAYNNGAANAYSAMINSSITRIYSRDLLPLGTPSVVTTPNQKSSLYEFTGLRLLTYNNGKYYLFREFDLTTCKPRQVYVIADRDIVSVTIEDASLTLPQCSLSLGP